MATSPQPGSGEPGCAPTAPFITLTPNMQAFYAGRGMWLDGRPCGALAAMLGEPAPWKTPYGACAFWVTHQQIHELRQDLSTCGARHALTGQQVGQFMRRLREAEARAGLPLYALHAVEAGPTPPAAAPRPPAAARAPVPFSPLVLPPEGSKAHQGFARHVFACLRDVVDFQQTSAYGA